RTPAPRAEPSGSSPPGLGSRRSSPDVDTPLAYSAESEHWRAAARLRCHGWAGYRIGMRAMHYWGEPHAPPSWLERKKRALDHQPRRLRRDLRIDCIVRSELALARAAAELAEFRPEVLIAYAGGAAALARHVNDQGLRRWADIPVIIAA